MAQETPQQLKDKSKNVEKLVLTGDGIAGLFPAPPTAKIKIDYQDKILEFEIQPLDNETFAKIGDKIKINNIDFDLAESKNSLVGMKIVSDLYWPALKIVLPKCCVNPRMIDGISTDPKVISVNQIKLEVGIALFDKILQVSGLGTDNDESRKN